MSLRGVEITYSEKGSEVTKYWAEDDFRTTLAKQPHSENRYAADLERLISIGCVTNTTAALTSDVDL